MKCSTTILLVASLRGAALAHADPVLRARSAALGSSVTCGSAR
jgi:hypothetical protein